MNKTKIEWCTHTWNPVTGCYHGCPYCYADRMTIRFSGHWDDNTLRTVGGDGNLHVLDEPMYRHTSGKSRDVGVRSVVAPFPFGFDPTFHCYKLDEPLRKKKPQTIFVCSMADLFGGWVPDAWIEEVFAACQKAPQHRYLFLTKNPRRYIHLAMDGLLPKGGNMWYGSTITNPDTPFFVAEDFNTFLSIEPLLEPFDSNQSDSITLLCAPKWIIIGALTGPSSKEHQPRREWVQNIVEAAREVNVPVFMKQNLAETWGDDLIQEFPMELRGRK